MSPEEKPQRLGHRENGRGASIDTGKSNGKYQQDRRSDYAADPGRFANPVISSPASVA